MIGSARPGPAQLLTGTCVRCESAQRTIAEQARTIHELERGKYGRLYQAGRIIDLEVRIAEQARQYDKLLERAEQYRTQLTGWVAAADKAQQPREFYKEYSESTMNAMQALLTKAGEKLAVVETRNKELEALLRGAKKFTVTDLLRRIDAALPVHDIPKEPVSKQTHSVSGRTITDAKQKGRV